MLGISILDLAIFIFKFAVALVSVWISVAILMLIGSVLVVIYKHYKQKYILKRRSK
jgi:O-antigen/teichoic acid export membrane protein